VKIIATLPQGSDRALEPLLPEECERIITDSIANLSGEQLAEAGAVIVTAYNPLTAEDIARLNGLKLIQQLGIGTDSIDLEAAKAAGIPVANVPTANVDAVADFAVMAMVYCLRKIGTAQSVSREGKRIDRVVLKLGSFDMAGKRVGLVGFGNIGRAVARRANAFGCEVVYSDPTPADAGVEQSLNVRRVEFDELIETSDIISIHAPLLDSTRSLINAGTFAVMKRGVVFINTARGGIVDESALTKALESGHVGAAAVDAFEVEPIAEDNPLLNAPNVMLTCHIAGVTNDCIKTMYREAVANCLRVINGEPPINRIV
jgi:D-3-phosphoglycerate dehydrogenase / 2-oxoglutarate reductase